MRHRTFYITVKPKASRNEVVKRGDGVLVRVTAPPAEGAANAAVVAALSMALGIPPSRVTITAGAAGRVKRISVSGLTSEELDERLNRLPAE